LVVEKWLGDVASSFTLLVVQAFGRAATVLVVEQLGLWGAFVLIDYLPNVVIG
jgi:hypothetical protein